MPYSRPLVLCLELGGDSHQSCSLAQTLPVLAFLPGRTPFPAPRLSPLQVSLL